MCLKGWGVRGWTVVGAEPLGKGPPCRRRQSLLVDVWNDGGHSDEVQGFEVWPPKAISGQNLKKPGCHFAEHSSLFCEHG